MRISTSLLYEQGTRNIMERQSALARVGQQLGTGKRMVSPGDDPVAAGQSILARSSLSRIDRMQSSQTDATNAISNVESTLGQIGDVYQDVKTLLVQAGNGSLSKSDRATLAQSLAGARDQLLGLANSRDAAGNYLFAGTRDNAAPFVATAGGVTYAGDDATRQIRVSDSRSFSATLNGASLFQNLPEGNGVFVAAAAAGNTGGASVDAGSVYDATALTGRSFNVSFHVSGGNTTYDIIDSGSGSVLSAGNKYTSGSPVEFEGARIGIAGAPANGDSFSVRPAQNKSVFDTLNQAIGLLRDPGATAADRARITSGLNAAVAHVDAAFNTSLDARASAGSSLAELDALASAQSARSISEKGRLSQIEDVNYAQAASDLAQVQLSSDAAQKAFAKIMGKSLFDFL